MTTITATHLAPVSDFSRGRNEDRVDVPLTSTWEGPRLVIDVGTDGVRVFLAVGDRPIEIRKLNFGIKQSALAPALANATDHRDLVPALRTRARQIVSGARLESPAGGPLVVEITGAAAAVVGFAGEGRTRATLVEIRSAIDRLLAAAARSYQQDLGPDLASLTLPGVILLEAILDYVGADALLAVGKTWPQGDIGGVAGARGDAGWDARMPAAA